MIQKYFNKYLLVVCTFVLFSCGDSEIPDPVVPNPSGVDFEIDINQSPYTALLNVGGSATVSSKSVIVARISSSSWAALASTCPNNSSNPISFVTSNNTFKCASDNTVFDATGKVVSGTSSALKAYKTTFLVNSGILRVYE